MRSRSAALFICASIAFSPALVIPQEPKQQNPVVVAPRHLSEALALVDQLKGSSLNVYGGGKRQIHWDTVPATARTVCSSFATLLLQHTYRYSNEDIKSWFGLVNPKAKNYHDEIVKANRFKRILRVVDLCPGDYLAIRYNDHHISSNGEENTGHVMLVVEPPKLVESFSPLIGGTSQYLVKIVDSTSTGHGKTDTRRLPTGKFSGGIGIGLFRLYADGQGGMVGYAWSDSSHSDYYTAPDRDLVAGRLEPPHTH